MDRVLKGSHGNKRKIKKFAISIPPKCREFGGEKERGRLKQEQPEASRGQRTLNYGSLYESDSSSSPQK